MKKKVIIFILIIIMVYAIGGFVYIKLLNPKEEATEVQEIDSIKNFAYSLKSNANELYKKEFDLLKTNLTSEEINDEEYAMSIAKLFIIDLYSLNSKINKYDVGGSDFVYPSALDNYKLNVQNTIYKYLEDNTYNNRAQRLPDVVSITISKQEKTNYKIRDNSFNGYKVNLEWTYNVDLGYESKGEVILIKENDKYYVVEKN